ncbi:MAG: hypothetical protein AAGA85_22935 [Bacteroidota bacterium]
MEKVRHFFFLACIGTAIMCQAQEGVGIGTNAPNASAALDVTSTNKGLLVPRNAGISTPADGLIYYDTDTEDVRFREGNQWSGGIPQGGIIMWSGDPNNLPKGWELCDGQGGRPDLRGQFVVGYDPRDPDYSSTRLNGGEASTTELPSHTHAVDITSDQDSHEHNYQDSYSRETLPVGVAVIGRDQYGSNGRARNLSHAELRRTTSSHTHSHRVVGNTQPTGTTQGIENRPPYYVLAFIIKQ